MVLNVPQSGIEVLIITGHMEERNLTAQFQVREFFSEYLKIQQWAYSIRKLLVFDHLLLLGKNWGT